MTVGETGVDKTVVEETGVDELGIKCDQQLNVYTYIVF